MKFAYSKLLGQKTIVLLIILAIGFVARVVQLGTTPQGMHADDASFLLNAKSLLETGRDEDGRFLPLSLHSLIDPKPALYSYLEIPFVAALGTSVVAGRLPAVIIGVISLWLFYLILIQLAVKKNTALIATLLMAVSPWHIMISRATQEVILSFACLLAAALFLLKYVDKQQSKLLIPLSVFSFLSMYFYHSNKIFLVTAFAGWLGVCIWQKKITLKKSILPIVLLVVMFVLSLSLQESSTRFSAVGFLSNQEPQLILDEQIRTATGESSPTVLRFFYNKPVFYARDMVAHYLEHYSPDFLFFMGGEPKRYMIPFQGLLYLVELPLLLFGIGLTLREKKKAATFMLVWLLLAPLPAALTFIETPSVIRAFVLIVPLLYFIGEALAWLFVQKFLSTKVLAAVVVIGYIWCGAYFWQQLSVQQKVYRPWYRNTPYTKIATAVKEKEAQYSKVFVINDLRPLYAYFALEGLIPIAESQKNPLARNQDEYQVGKYVFSRRSCDIESPEEGVLYIAESQCEFKNPDYTANVEQVVTYDDGVPVYSLITFKKNEAVEN